MNTEADVVWVDGHSDYGHAFEVFHQRHFAEITPKTSIILLGDARNNYHASQTWVRRRAAQARPPRLLARTPSRAATGTPATRSSPSTAMYCDGVFECRNLRQLERFVAAVIEA